MKILENVDFNSLNPELAYKDFYNYGVFLIAKGEITPNKNKTINRLYFWNEAISQAIKQLFDNRPIKNTNIVHIIASVYGISLEDARSHYNDANREFMKLGLKGSEQSAYKYVMKNKIDVECSFIRFVFIVWAYIGYISNFKTINGKQVKYIKLNYFPRVDRTNDKQYTANIKFIDVMENEIINENYDGVILDKVVGHNRDTFIKDALNSVFDNVFKDVFDKCKLTYFLPVTSDLNFYTSDLKETDLGYFCILENDKNNFSLMNLAVPTEPLLSRIQQLIKENKIPSNKENI